MSFLIHLGLLQWHWPNQTIAAVPMKQPWGIWLIIIFHKKTDYTTTKAYTTQLCHVSRIYCMTLEITTIYTVKPRQNGRRFADDIFKSIFQYENLWISTKISPKFVLLCRIDIKSPSGRQAIIWNNGGLIYWRLYILRGPSYRKL